MLGLLYDVHGNLGALRAVLDELVRELLDKETLTRKDLERIFSNVEKRPRITALTRLRSALAAPNEMPGLRRAATRK